MKAIAVTATTLSPFHHHSLAVQSGTATLPTFMPDRALSFALANAMGALRALPVLPLKPKYKEHLGRLPWLASVFETDEPRLMRPLAKRLNLDTEGGYQKAIIDATGTGNLKTYFYIQEVPPGVVYKGAFFGEADPFDLVAETTGRPCDEIVVRIGRHLGGVVKIERATHDVVRLNAHTARYFDDRRKLPVEIYALHNLQVTPRLSIERSGHSSDMSAAEIVGGWRFFH
jgi:hypothetical protein